MSFIMSKDGFDIQREQMIKRQLIGRDITDTSVLNAFKETPRHKFVNPEQFTSAYSDCPLPIGENQTISQPYIVALMTQALNLKNTDKILEIGTGSGYQTAILAYLAKEVFSIERKENLAKRAKAILRGLNYTNIKIKLGDGTCGWKEYSPFNKIIVTAASPDLPLPLYEQLEEGGRLVIPIASGFAQTLTLFIKESAKMKKEEICGCSFVPLIGKFAYEEK